MDLVETLLGDKPKITINAKLASRFEYFVVAFLNGREAAKASVKLIGKKKLRMAGIGVEERFRRKGVATAIYKHMEELTGRTFVRGLKQTGDGLALWNSPKRTFGVT